MNFVLEYLRLEDKRPENIRLPYECEWCGDNYGGRKRKYCSAKCREEEHIHLLRERSRQKAIKRQQKRLALEKEKRDKRMAALEKEMERLLANEFYCLQCDKKLEGSKRKFCDSKCDTLYRNSLINKQVSKTDVSKDEGSKQVYIDPKEYGHCTLGVIEPNNPFVVYDLNDGLPQEDIYALKTSMRLGIADAKKIEAKRLRKSLVKS